MKILPGRASARQPTPPRRRARVLPIRHGQQSEPERISFILPRVLNRLLRPNELRRLRHAIECDRLRRESA